MSLDLVLRAPRAIVGGAERPCAVAVSDGVVTAVLEYGASVDAASVVELADDELLIPGLVDTHVHVNEPGRTEWEGFATATRAAAYGGVTTIIDMPLNSVPPTIDVAALEVKRKAAEGQAWVDVGFWGGAVPGNASELAALHAAGVFGFKCFLLDSGVAEFPPLDRDQLAEALHRVAAIGSVMLVHAEDAATVESAPAAAGPSYADFLSSRPSSAEQTAVSTVVDLASRTGARTHVLHASSAEAVRLVADARRAGVWVSVETCPHYLTLAAEDVPDGDTRFKCCPPIRGAANRERLWAGLAAGEIDLVVSDHSPCTPELKRLDLGDFGVAWGGISSLQIGLAVVWTAASARGHSLADVVRWMAAGPAKLAGLSRKGSIAPGSDADFAVFAPDATFVVDPGGLHHRNPLTPYAGRELRGVVRRTWLRGQPVGDQPGGRLLTRTKARERP